MGNFFTKVYKHMFLGLLITFFTAFSVASSETLFNMVFGSTLVYFGIIISELVFVIYFSTRIMTMEPGKAKFMFYIYSLLSGLTFSIIFITFNMSSIIIALGITSLLYGVLALYGAITKKDISKLGPILFAGLIGVLITSIINIFLNNNTYDLIITIFGLFIFLGFTLYDNNRIKNIYLQNPSNENIAIYGAFQLYLDYINLFIRILSLVDRNKN